MVSRLRQTQENLKALLTTAATGCSSVSENLDTHVLSWQ